MSIRSDYYKLSKKDFDTKLKIIKEDENTFKFFSNTKIPFFYYETPTISQKILELNKLVWEFETLYKSFSEFGKNQIIQSYLINEIKSTNEIENIVSTRHDIFYIIKSNEFNCNQKIQTICRTYLYLLTDGVKELKNKKDIRILYDYLFKDTLDKDNLPDGKYFRKGPVHISNGLKNVHNGFYPEEIINSAMDEFLKLYNSDFEPFIKGIITHFMFETIHPYYDGNGRLGRFLFSNQLLKDTKSYYAILIANAFNSYKSKYYKAFKEGRDVYEFGCINEYVLIILDILIDSIIKEINNLRVYQDLLNEDSNIKLNSSEKIIYKLLIEATILSDYGVSNNELIKFSGLSRRTVVSVMNRFKEKKSLVDTQIGRTTYHKLKK